MKLGPWKHKIWFVGSVIHKELNSNDGGDDEITRNRVSSETEQRQHRGARREDRRTKGYTEVETTREGTRRKLEGREKQRGNVQGDGVGLCNTMEVGKGLGKLGRQGGGEITRIMEIVEIVKGRE